MKAAPWRGQAKELSDLDAYLADQSAKQRVKPKSNHTLNEVFIPAGYYTIRDLEQILTNQKKWKEEHEAKTAKK